MQRLRLEQHIEVFMNYNVSNNIRAEQCEWCGIQNMNQEFVRYSEIDSSLFCL